ncbi:fumarylacetoacetate hydrolase family protein [Pseudopedobacter beijingensis]|uniref:Fumarylacetoacetate hydrolase family protein n=1 Tax=Pseudopedobacter beijingensis TaxID=1207056 RepID=A0ABW4IFH9_9SPHI
MKVIAIGRNYTEHAKELNNPVPDEPVIFLKPDTAVSKNNRPFYIPDFSSDIHYEVELVLKVAKEGKHIAQKFASKYYEEIGLGLDLTARDLQTKLKSKGLPWELAKGFDNSAPVSEFLPLSEFADKGDINFSLTVNGDYKQRGNSKDMIFSFDQIIAFVSQYITLKKGDLIFTGTPVGVGRLNIGDKLVGYIEDKELLNIEVK